MRNKENAMMHLEKGGLTLKTSQVGAEQVAVNLNNKVTDKVVHSGKLQTLIHKN
jgi:hypothetical protein